MDTSASTLLDRSPEAADARCRDLGRSEDVIPEGDYCYRPAGPVVFPEDGSAPRLPIALCPYWARRTSPEGGTSGYCAFLGCGDDDENGTLLLFDQTKECGIKEPE